MDLINGFSSIPSTRPLENSSQAAKPVVTERSGDNVGSESTTALVKPSSASARPLGLKETSLTFQVNSEANEVVIQIVDRNTGEVVRQVPPEEIRQLARVLRLLNENGVDELA